MTASQVRALLRRAVADSGGSIRQFAKDKEITYETVSVFLRGGRDTPGPSILKILGLEQRVSYVRKL